MTPLIMTMSNNAYYPFSQWLFHQCQVCSDHSHTLPCTSGWRPSFKFYSQWVALLGSAVCLVIMFVISWWAALVTLVAVGTLYKIVDWTKPGEEDDGPSFAFSVKDYLKH